MVPAWKYTLALAGCAIKVRPEGQCDAIQGMKQRANQTNATLAALPPFFDQAGILHPEARENIRRRMPFFLL